MSVVPRSRRVPWVLGAVVLVAVGTWWTWPTVAGDERPGVLVVDDGFLTPGRRSMELRAREGGRSVRWATFDPGWCADPGALADRVREVDPDTVVLAVGAVPACASALAPAFRGRAVIALAEPGSATSAADLSQAGYEVVDPQRLAGPSAPSVRLPCEWWEQCDGDGRIAVRDRAGKLTPAGQERVSADGRRRAVTDRCPPRDRLRSGTPRSPGRPTAIPSPHAGGSTGTNGGARMTAVGIRRSAYSCSGSCSASGSGGSANSS